MSTGGYGTRDAVARHPDRFAAAVPICGAGGPARAAAIRENRVSVRAFHGGNDRVVPAQGFRHMVEAIKKAGGDPKYAEYPDVGHDSRSKAWNEPDLIDWLLGQRRATEQGKAK
jgi:predicted peptidase